DVGTPQNDRSHVERRLVSVDEENFLPGKNRAATKWWRAIHTTLPKLERALEKRFARILLLERAGVKRELGHSQAPPGLITFGRRHSFLTLCRYDTVPDGSLLSVSHPSYERQCACVSACFG